MIVNNLLLAMVQVRIRMRFGVSVRSGRCVRDTCMPAVTKNEYGVCWQAQDMGVTYFNVCLICRKVESAMTSYCIEQIST